MTQFLFVILIMSLTCVGYHIAVNQFIHFFTGKWSEDIEFKNKVLQFIAKPLFKCVLCHASIIGSIVYFVLTPFTIEMTPLWIISCFCCVFLNGILYGAFDRIF